MYQIIYNYKLDKHYVKIIIIPEQSPIYERAVFVEHDLTSFPNLLEQELIPSSLFQQLYQMDHRAIETSSPQPANTEQRELEKENLFILLLNSFLFFL